MKLTCVSYPENADIPAQYATRHVDGGKNISPAFSWSEFPPAVKSFALIMVDRHPRAGGWVHWMVINIPANIYSLEENISNTSKLPSGALELANTFGSKGYGGPQPPAGSGRHEYCATIYALDTERLSLPGQPLEKSFIDNASKHILAKASASGFFSR